MQKSQKTYQDLLDDKKGNDTLAFKEVYLIYWERLYIYSFNILKNKKICEDLIQEIFLAFWKNRKHTEIENLNAYLYQSLRFQIFKYYRDNKIAHLDVDKFNNISKKSTLEDSLHLQDLENEIHKHLDKLPNRCQEIFYLSRFENLSNKEIAEKLGISIQTVKNQLTTALKYLRKNLKNYSFYLILSILFNIY